jgi:acyl-CoA reductase-like NAD-dependent aldehyde dehydrogenase
MNFPASCSSMGCFVPAQSGRTFQNVNPATGEVIGQAAEGDAADVDAAVQAAVRAQKAWARLRRVSAANRLPSAGAS